MQKDRANDPCAHKHGLGSHKASIADPVSCIHMVCKIAGLCSMLYSLSPSAGRALPGWPAARLSQDHQRWPGSGMLESGWVRLLAGSWASSRGRLFAVARAPGYRCLGIQAVALAWGLLDFLERTLGCNCLGVQAGALAGRCSGVLETTLACRCDVGHVARHCEAHAHEAAGTLCFDKRL